MSFYYPDFVMQRPSVQLTIIVYLPYEYTSGKIEVNAIAAHIYSNATNKSFSNTLHQDSQNSVE